MLDQRSDYIHNNPIEADLVEKAEEYIFSSERDYSGSVGLLPILKIEWLKGTVEKTPAPETDYLFLSKQLMNTTDLLI